MGATAMSPRVRPLLLFVVCVAVYASNGKTLNMGDSVPARLMPVALLLDRTPMLDRFADALHAGTPQAYFVHHTPYGLASFYPIATGVLATPVVAPAVLWLEWTEQPDPARWIAVTRPLEKLAATVLTALAVVVFDALCLQLGVVPGLALAATLTFAFGSQAYSTSSQALWQHGPGCLAIVAALWCLTRAARRAATGEATAGIIATFSACCALAVAIRPNDVLIVAPLALVALRRHPRDWAALALPALAGAAALLAYNSLLFGTLSGGYGVAAPMTFEFASALPGLLLSPGRGLFVYFPVTVVLVLLLVLEPRAFANDLAAALLTGIVATLLLTAAWPNWWGGYCYGPRLLTETQPAILLLVALGIQATASQARKRALTIALWVLLPLQIALQAIGTYGPPGQVPAALSWNAAPVSIDVAPQRNWDLADNPIARGVRALRGGAGG
jgi:hypothetical protein